MNSGLEDPGKDPAIKEPSRATRRPWHVLVKPQVEDGRARKRVDSPLSTRAAHPPPDHLRCGGDSRDQSAEERPPLAL